MERFLIESIFTIQMPTYIMPFMLIIFPGQMYLTILKVHLHFLLCDYDICAEFLEINFGDAVKFVVWCSPPANIGVLLYHLLNLNV